MNQYLLKFINDNDLRPGKALDLGAGEMFEVSYLKHLGWDAQGVDLKTGVDLNKEYRSPENLKSGGRVFFLTFDKSDANSRSRFDESNAEEAFAAAGFVGIRTATHDFYDNDEGHKHWHKIMEVSASKP